MNDLWLFLLIMGSVLLVGVVTYPFRVPILLTLSSPFILIASAVEWFRHREKCKPFFACSRHGRCWTHSEWDSCPYCAATDVFLHTHGGYVFYCRVCGKTWKGE